MVLASRRDYIDVAPMDGAMAGSMGESAVP